MFPLFTVLKALDGTVETFEGTLFKMPAELRDRQRIERYASTRNAGWFRSEFGYYLFAKANDAGDLYIFPGLRISGERKPDRGFHGYTKEFEKREIETFADGLFQLISERNEKVEANLNLLVHDLRRLSGAIYHAAEEAKSFLEARDFDNLRIRLGNVTAAQTMLKIRTDLIDFQENTSVTLNEIDVPIYRRVDKVVRCFTPLANSGGIRIAISGSSFSSVHGPDIFEIIPYILIDNALKYSPRNEEVGVFVGDRDGSTQMTIRSLGPVVEAEEIGRVFDNGFRGRNAVKSGKPGSGIGLFLARNLLDRFGATITMMQGQSRHLIRGVEMSETTFAVDIPKTRPGY